VLIRAVLAEARLTAPALAEGLGPGLTERPLPLDAVSGPRKKNKKKKKRKVRPRRS